MRRERVWSKADNSTNPIQESSIVIRDVSRNRSLHQDFAGHLRVNRAEVRISSRFAKSEGELLIRIEHFGFEDPVRADHRVWNIVAIRPRYGRSHCDRQRSGTEAEVINFHLCRFRLLLRACQNAVLPAVAPTHPDPYRPPTY